MRDKSSRRTALTSQSVSSHQARAEGATKQSASDDDEPDQQHGAFGDLASTIDSADLSSTKALDGAKPSRRKSSTKKRSAIPSKSASSSAAHGNSRLDELGLQLPALAALKDNDRRNSLPHTSPSLSAAAVSEANDNMFVLTNTNTPAPTSLSPRYQLSRSTSMSEKLVREAMGDEMISPPSKPQPRARFGIFNRLKR
jgi:hypothetical protein